MDSEVIKFVKEHSCNLGETNYEFGITIRRIKSTFGVDSDKMAQFLTTYCQLAEEDERFLDVDNPCRRKHSLCISEKLNKNTSPIVVTHFFQFSLEKKDDVFISSKFMNGLIYSHQQAIKQVFNISSEMNELTTAVLKTPMWKFGRIDNCMIELRFPYCQVSRNIQKTSLKTAIINKLYDNNVLSLLDIQPIGDWDQIIIRPRDNQADENFLPLYRSTNDISCPPSKFSHIMGAMKSIKDGDAEMQLEDVFNPADHTYIRSGEIDKNFLDSNKDINYWIPLFLSAYFYAKVTNPKENKEEEEIKEELYADSDSAIGRAQIFLNIISSHTINQENYWLDIGRALYNITKTLDSTKGLEMFIRASIRANKETENKKSNGEIETKCRKIWPKLKNSVLTEKTLGWFARMDNEFFYKDWHIVWLSSAFELAMTEMTDLDIVEIMYRFFWLEFVCSDMKGDKWWYFPKGGHYFVPMVDARNFRVGITNEIIPRLYSYSRDLFDKIIAIGCKREHAREKENYEMQIQQVTTLIKKLKSCSFRNKIVTMCKEKFYVENFEKLIDKGVMKTVWRNCVLEICGKKAIIRPGKPEDFSTKVGNVEYHTEFSYEHPIIKECMEYLSQVFPDIEIRSYFCKDIASFLIGNNLEKQFRIWFGKKSDNSITTMMKIIREWWGDSYSSEVTNIKHLIEKDRCLIFVTSNNDSKSNMSKIRKENPLIISSKRIIFSDSKMKNITDFDKKNVASLPFLARFVNNPPEDPEKQKERRLFKKDIFFDRHISKLAEAMFWLAVEWFPTYMEEGLEQPEIIKEYTKKYLKEYQ